MLLRWSEDHLARYEWLIGPEDKGPKQGIGTPENPNLIKALASLKDVPGVKVTSISNITRSVQSNTLQLAFDGEEEADDGSILGDPSDPVPSHSKASAKQLRSGKVRKKVLDEISKLAPYFAPFEFNKKEGHRIQDFKAFLATLDPPVVRVSSEMIDLPSDLQIDPSRWNTLDRNYPHLLSEYNLGYARLKTSAKTKPKTINLARTSPEITPPSPTLHATPSRSTPPTAATLQQVSDQTEDSIGDGVSFDDGEAHESSLTPSRHSPEEVARSTTARASTPVPLLSLASEDEAAEALQSLQNSNDTHLVGDDRLAHQRKLPSRSVTPTPDSRKQTGTDLDIIEQDSPRDASATGTISLIDQSRASGSPQAVLTGPVQATDAPATPVPIPSVSKEERVYIWPSSYDRGTFKSSWHSYIEAETGLPAESVSDLQHSLLR